MGIIHVCGSGFIQMQMVSKNDPVQLVLKGCESHVTLQASCCTYQLSYYSMLSTDVHVSIEYLEGSKRIIHVFMFHSITVCSCVVVFMLLSRK